MAVAFDAIGGGKAADTSSSNPNNFTWSHTASGTDRAVLVFVTVTTNGADFTSNITRSATYGGVSMTELAAGPAGTNATAGTHHLIVFGLINPASGAQTVAVNIGGVATGASGNSQSYTGVGSFGTVSAVAGAAAGTAMSQPVTGSAVGRQIAQSFIAANTTNGTSISSYNQTTRFNIAKAAWSAAIVGGDAAGAASTVTFSGIRTSGVAWRSYAVDMIEAVAANTGAFFALF